MNRTPRISKTHVKAYALACGQQRAWKPTRVSQDFLDAMDAALRGVINRHVMNHPSVGTTIR